MAIQPPCFELRIELIRSSDNTTKEDVLKFSAPPSTVKDLKVTIQDRYNIPQCLQTLTIGDRYIRSDDDRLSNLYVVSGDSIKVSYLYEAPVQALKLLTECVKQMEERLVAQPEQARSKSSLDHQVMSLYYNCYRLLEVITYEVLSPWLSDETTASRKCLVQVGAVDAVLSLLKFLQTNFPWTERVSESQKLEDTLLGFLWNLAETTDSQAPVVSRGGFQLMVAALMHVNITKLNTDPAGLALFGQAVGCVSKYEHTLDYKCHVSHIGVFLLLL